MRGLQPGTVVEFDSAVGVGQVQLAAGQFIFHCTAIAGGGRNIAVGTKVIVRVAPGGPGRWEAFDLTVV